MSRRNLRYAASAIALATVPVGTAWAEGGHGEIMRLAEDKKFDAALARLELEDPAKKGDVEHLLLKARLLSWSGRYEAAQDVLSALKSANPENSDVDVALGSLAFYQSEFERAEKYYSDALAITPDHGDAASGLSRVNDAKAEAKKNDTRWRVDAGFGRSTFDTSDIEEWGEQFVNVSHKRDNVALSVGATRYERFGAVDTQINAAIGKAKPGGLDWGLMAAATPDADFRAKSTLGGHFGGSFAICENVTAYAAVRYRRDSFEDKAVQSVQPEITAYFTSGTTVTAKAFVTSEKDEDTQVGWLAEVRQPVGDKVRVKLGVADAPELINGASVNTQSLFGGVSFDVSDDLTFHVNLARSDRENLHVRKDFSVGITRKF